MENKIKIDNLDSVIGKEYKRYQDFYEYIGLAVNNKEDADLKAIAKLGWKSKKINGGIVISEFNKSLFSYINNKGIEDIVTDLKNYINIVIDYSVLGEEKLYTVSLYTLFDNFLSSKNVLMGRYPQDIDFKDFFTNGLYDIFSECLDKNFVSLGRDYDYSNEFVLDNISLKKLNEDEDLDLNIESLIDDNFNKFKKQYYTNSHCKILNKKYYSNLYNKYIESKQNSEQREKEAEIKRLKTMKYKDYLRTDHWKNLAKQNKKDSNYTCNNCGRSNATHNNLMLVSHHTTYENRGDYDKELLDLECLCQDCHALHHGHITQEEWDKVVNGNKEKGKCDVCGEELSIMNFEIALIPSISFGELQMYDDLVTYHRKIMIRCDECCAYNLRNESDLENTHLEQIRIKERFRITRSTNE